jgi:hypothetical protein
MKIILKSDCPARAIGFSDLIRNTCTTAKELDLMNYRSRLILIVFVNKATALHLLQGNLATDGVTLLNNETNSIDLSLWFLLFTANIQNQRENLGMMRTRLVLFTFLIPLLLQISKMRELYQILLLRETSPSRLMRKLLYPLPKILDDGPVTQLASILLLGGFEEQMEEWSMLISVSLGA